MAFTKKATQQIALPFLTPREVPSVNKTRTATNKQTFFSTMRLHEPDPRNKTEQWRGRKERQLQHLVWSLDCILPSATAAATSDPSKVKTSSLWRASRRSAPTLAQLLLVSWSLRSETLTESTFPQSQSRIKASAGRRLAALFSPA